MCGEVGGGGERTKKTTRRKEKQERRTGRKRNSPGKGGRVKNETGARITYVQGRGQGKKRKRNCSGGNDK